MEKDQLEMLKHYASEIKECVINECSLCRLNAEIIETVLGNEIENAAMDNNLETVTAPYKGIEYHRFGMGRHKISFQVPDGATNIHCTFQRKKTYNVFNLKPRAHTKHFTAA